MKSIAHSTLFYGIATGINRGAALLFFPLLVSIFTIEEYGIFSLVQVFSILITPIVTLNGVAPIFREGSEDPSKGMFLLRKHLLFTSAIGAGVLPLAYLLDLSDHQWIFYSALIACSNGLVELPLSFYRANDDFKNYTVLVFLKTAVMLLFFAYCLKISASLSFLLAGQAALFALVGAIYAAILGSSKYTSTPVKLKEAVIFGVTLIPHSLSQWVMSSSDRLIIKEMDSETNLGIYSLAYTISMGLMLLNSGLAIALPTHIIKNYKEWEGNSGPRLKTITLYTFGAMLAIAFIILGVKVDQAYFGFIKFYEPVMFQLILMICGGMYLLGLYYFYSNYLFYHRKSSYISISTIIASICNVALTILFCHWYGFVGAGISTLLSYAIYVAIIIFFTLKVIPSMKSGIVKDFLPVGAMFLFLCIFAWLLL